jgi:hypothetical protein
MKKITFFLPLITFFLLFFSTDLFSQAQQQSDGKAATGKVSRGIARSKKSDKRKMEKATKKSIDDHHKRLQTKDTRKRMKSNQKKAGKNNRRQNL